RDDGVIECRVKLLSDRCLRNDRSRLRYAAGLHCDIYPQPGNPVQNVRHQYIQGYSRYMGLVSYRLRDDQETDIQERMKSAESLPFDIVMLALPRWDGPYSS